MSDKATGYWTFFCNPKVWDIEASLLSNPVEDYWQILDWQIDLIKTGHYGIVRVGKDNRTKAQLNGRTKLQSGVYAFVEIVSEPIKRKDVKDASNYWSEDGDVKPDRYVVKVRFEYNLIKSPLLINVLEFDPIISTENTLINGWQGSCYYLQENVFDKLLQFATGGIPGDLIKQSKETKRIPIPEGITREDVLNARDEIENGLEHSFGNATGYVVKVGDKYYPPKLIIGVAAKRLREGKFLPHNRFSSGEESHKHLRPIGFEIFSIKELPPDAEVYVNPSKSQKGSSKSGKRDWTYEELEASVDTYMAIYDLDSTNQKYVKKDFYTELSEKIGRSYKSCEYRMQNISAVLDKLGMPWIEGLKPAKNVGTGVAAKLEEIIRKNISQEQDEELELYEPEEIETKVLEQSKKKYIPKPVGRKVPQRKTASITQYSRSASVIAYVLSQAKGKCECCRETAPFITRDGRPYLEVHHLRRLADGGSDTPENAVGLCPNCHRRLHYSEDAPEVLNKLYNDVERLVKE